MLQGLIFNIKRFSVHDGPGIRTMIFLKGCPLKCTWCHNPESQKFEMEEFEIIRKVEENNFRSREKVGNYYTVDQLMEKVRSDIPFFDESGGGVTLSGGEPLSQPEFSIELLKKCKQEGIHTAIDTCGYTNWEILEKTIPYTNLYLFDLKIMNSEIHQKYTGVGNEVIIENLFKLSKFNNNIHLRIPLVQGITDTDENINEIKSLVSRLKSLKRIDLLPYHSLAKQKYQRFYNQKYPLESLGEYPEVKANQIKLEFEGLVSEVSIGG